MITHGMRGRSLWTGERAHPRMASSHFTGSLRIASATTVHPHRHSAPHWLGEQVLNRLTAPY